MKGNKNVREIWHGSWDTVTADYKMALWCDRCRVFTDNPEKHKHDQNPLD
jgi:hypothetical protein